VDQSILARSVLAASGSAYQRSASEDNVTKVVGTATGRTTPYPAAMSFTSQVLPYSLRGGTVLYRAHESTQAPLFQQNHDPPF
jgi:hypothetical protein